MHTFAQRYRLRVGYETFMRVAHDLDSIVRAHHKRCTCYAYVAETPEAVVQVYFDRKITRGHPDDARTFYVRGAFTEDIWRRTLHLQMVWEDHLRRRPVRVAITVDRILSGNAIEFSAVGVSAKAVEKIQTIFGTRSVFYSIGRKTKKK